MSARTKTSAEGAVYRKLNWYRDPVVEPIVIATMKKVCDKYVAEGKLDARKWRHKWTGTVAELENHWNFTVDPNSLKSHREYLQERLDDPKRKFSEHIARTALNTTYPITYVPPPMELSSRSADKSLYNKIMERLDNLGRRISDIQRSSASTKSTPALPALTASLSSLKSLHSSAKTQKPDKRSNEDTKSNVNDEDDDVASIDEDDADVDNGISEEVADVADTIDNDEGEAIEDDNGADGNGDSDDAHKHYSAMTDIDAATVVDPIPVALSRKRPREAVADVAVAGEVTQENPDDLLRKEHRKKSEVDEAERIVTAAKKKQALIAAELSMAKQQTSAAKMVLKAQKKPVSTAGQRSSMRVGKAGQSAQR